MAVQHAGEALDAWLDTKIKMQEETCDVFTGPGYGPDDGDYAEGYLKALKDVKAQLAKFWGASLTK